MNLVVKPKSPTLFLLLALASPLWGAGAGAVEVSLFAPSGQCGQVMALTTDDRGRLYAAVTQRAFGRGTVSPMGDPVMTAQDQALRSITAREQMVTGWLASGRLDPLWKERASFFRDADDRPGNLLTKYSESICWLPDLNADGKAEVAVVVADAFRDPMDGPGSALLALPRGRWLYGCPPHLWRLEDLNEDQRAEERASVADGFGLANDPWGADLHALLEAPDGWIYWSMGERGYALRGADGRTLRGLGSGAVFRCRPDGSGVERVARGLRNPVALAMLPDGRLLAVDEAAPGGRTRLLWVIAGADYGWRATAVGAAGKGVWFEEGMEAATLKEAPETPHPRWALPALTPLDGAWSALEVLPDGTLMAGDRQTDGKGGVSTWSLEPEGLSYRVERRQILWQGGAVMALAQSPDGRVYFADWGDQVEAGSRCEVRQLTWPAMPDAVPGPGTPPLVETPTALLAKLPEMTVRDLKRLLDSPVPRVALRARQRLEGMRFQDSMEALLQVARRGPSLPARLHGLRGAGAVAREETALLNELVVFMEDPEPAIRATTSTLLGEGRAHEAPAALRKALRDDSRPVRLAAAAAIARLKPSAILGQLMEAAADNPQRDPMVRSSLAHALAESVPAPALAAAAQNHPAAEARLVAVLALRRSAAPETATFLADPDSTVAMEAARAVYDLPLRPSYHLLSALLERPPLEEPAARRALAAAVYLGTPADAARVAAFATAPATTPELRRIALAALETWDQPPTADPIWKRPESALPRFPGNAHPAGRTAAGTLRKDPDKATAAAAERFLKATPDASLTAAGRLAVVNRADAPEPERLAALLSLIASNELSSETARTLTNPANPANPVIPPSLRAEARSFLMRRDPKSAVALTHDALATGSLVEKQNAIRTLDRLPGHGGEADKLLLELAKRLGAGGIEPGIQVEVLEAVQRRDIETRSPWRRALETWQASLSLDTDPLAPWRMTMADGDASAGRVIFETHPGADCLSCHSVAGTGGLTGPDLDGVASRLTSGGLLESLVHPGAKLVRGYARAPLDQPPGGAGAEEEPRSVMPPMGTLLTLRELRDLIAWLRSLKEP